MKLLLVLLCLLLCGCSREAPETETEIPVITAATVPETEPVSMYDSTHPLEEQHQGALKVYPLTMRKVRGIRAMGDNLLVFSGYGSTTLTMLSGEELSIRASITLDFELAFDDPSIQIEPRTLSYFDPSKQETVVLNENLKEVSRIDVVDPLSGSPILSSDRNTLYYCTSNAVQAWNLETGIHRTLKELSYDDQQLSGLHLNDTVLQCRIQDGDFVRTLFLSAETGQLLSQQEGDVLLITQEQRYYASLPVSTMDMLVFGDAAGSPQVLYPKDFSAESFFLPQNHAVITASILADETTSLNFYDLNTGLHQAELSLDSLQNPKCIAGTQTGFVYILIYDPASDCDTIYRWDVPALSVESSTTDTLTYTEAYSTKDVLDYEGLVQCLTYAAELSEKYGIQILVWEDALAVQPWDYSFEAEYLPRILYQELELLNQRLSYFPEGVLEKTVSHFSGLKICLVRQITGTAASGSLDAATGVQFLEGTDAYVVIAVGKYSEQALYHELFHVMETHILNKSVAFDQWSDLNPSDFEYAYSYDIPQSFSIYAEGEERAFVDTYSMSFPKEDRARIMENAMLPANKALFQSEIMQSKLLKLCEGIRQAYGLRKSQDTFLWEQYLQTSLAYTE